jgi:hypothetical protein
MVELCPKMAKNLQLCNQKPGFCIENSNCKSIADEINAEGRLYAQQPPFTCFGNGEMARMQEFRMSS